MQPDLKDTALEVVWR